jgi:general secretion pathway protein H
MTKPLPAARRARGVTLIELLVVLMIMAIVSAIVIPMFGNGVSTTDMKSATRSLAAGLRLARSQALATRAETTVLMDIDKRTFRVSGDPREVALPKQIELKVFTAQSDIASERTGAIRFFPDGGSNGGRVTLASGERKFQVDIDWLTGRVAILD